MAAERSAPKDWMQRDEDHQAASRQTVGGSPLPFLSLCGTRIGRDLLINWEYRQRDGASG